MPASSATASTRPGSACSSTNRAPASRRCRCRWRSGSRTYRRRASRISARRAPRRCAAPSMPSRPGHATSRSRWAWRNSRIPASAACRSARRARSRTCICRATRRRVRSLNWRAPTPTATATRSTNSNGPWRTSPARATRTRRAIPRRICATASRCSRCSTRRRSPFRWACYDCCGVSDGAACAIVTTPEIARSLGKRDQVSVKALQLAPSNGVEMGHRSWDGTHTLTTPIAARRAYAEAGIKDHACADRFDRGP